MLCIEKNATVRRIHATKISIKPMSIIVRIAPISSRSPAVLNMPLPVLSARVSNAFLRYTAISM